MQQNIWQRLSSAQKIGFLGSALLLISLFLNWYSDKDVFRSGDSYSAMSGPLYLVGFTILVLALFNIFVLFFSVKKSKLIRKWTAGTIGKTQMLVGFSSMYLLMVINSVYFHPQFGLNILDKKSEIGVMVALVATVMICVGGYLTFRKMHEQDPVLVKKDDDVAVTPATEATPADARVHTPIIQAVPTPVAVPVAPVKAQPVTPEISQKPAVERTPRVQTDYERAKLYENLKKTMIRDTLSPAQRRKEREKEIKQNAFSANFGKGPKYSTTKKTTGAPTVADTSASETDQPQMYRMDL